MNIEMYSMGVFVIIFISGCIINLLDHHYIIQLAGVSILFAYSVVKTVIFFNDMAEPGLKDFYAISLPIFSGMAACLVSMAIGFWIFPEIRKKFKN